MRNSSDEVLVHPDVTTYAMKNDACSQEKFYTKKLVNQMLPIIKNMYLGSHAQTHV